MRITPAGAGNTYQSNGNYLIYKDHPRGCGEYVGGYFFAKADIGSPPRVRGIHFPNFLLSVLTRITPAGAGNTRQPLLSDLRLPGSPPRVRGIH